MKQSKQSRKQMINFILAKIMYYLLLPFLFVRKVVVESLIKMRFAIARKKADKLHIKSGVKHYVVASSKNRFYVCNKGRMLNIAKKYRKMSGHKVEWKDICCYESKK